MVPASREDLRTLKEEGEQRTGKEQADMSLWLVARRGKGSMDKVLKQLNANPAVELTTAMPLPVEAPSLPQRMVRPAAAADTPDFSGRQGYAGPASGYGIDALAARNLPGGLGQNVAVADSEYQWDTAHEDLTKLARPGASIGTVYPFANPNTTHGTGVMGVLMGDADGHGVSGLVPGATPYMVPTYSTENGYNVAAALVLATQKLVPGDVILVEQQVGGCGEGDKDFVAAEWDPAVYDAVAAAVAKGIHVVEAGGNGNQDLDEECYGGANFPAGRGDSGAIIVGAAASSQGDQAPGTRMYFSTHGSRVNLNGWGEHVTTTGGNGDLFAANEHRTYTGSFNGTSSASPIVAGAVAQVSSIAEAKGRTITPEQMRAALVASGTTGPADQRIGVLPNLDASSGYATKEVLLAPYAGRTLTLRFTASEDSGNATTFLVDNVRVQN